VSLESLEKLVLDCIAIDFNRWRREINIEVPSVLTDGTVELKLNFQRYYSVERNELPLVLTGGEVNPRF
jgi:hypothetical protein